MFVFEHIVLSCIVFYVRIFLLLPWYAVGTYESRKKVLEEEPIRSFHRMRTLHLIDNRYYITITDYIFYTTRDIVFLKSYISIEFIMAFLCSAAFLYMLFSIWLILRWLFSSRRFCSAAFLYTYLYEHNF